MDLRKYKPVPLRNNSKEYSPFNRDTGFNDTSNKKWDSNNLRSPTAEEARAIEERHEELKRQIALKEKQLADMTGERDTVNMLRQRLGLDSQSKSFGQSSRDFFNAERSSRLNLTKVESKRGLASSLSPQNILGNQTAAGTGMVGLKSTHLRVTSEEGKYANPNRRFEEIGKRTIIPTTRNDDIQQLQFHPTRLRPAQQTHAQAPPHYSPLRSKSGGSQERRPMNESQQYPMSNSRNHYNNIPSQSSFERQERSNWSPLRETSPKLNESRAFNDEFIMRPQIVPQQVNQHASNVSFKPDRQISPHQAAEPAREKLYRDRIEAMTLDNQSLQRRLNQVSSELERIQRENEELYRQMNMLEGDVKRMDLLLDNMDDVDTQNKIMKQDLERIKFANLGLQDKLKQEEIESNDVGARLHHATNGRKNLEHESSNLNQDLVTRIRHFENISRDKITVQQKLNYVNNELERLNRDQLQMNHENIDMESHVERLLAERRDLLANIQRITIVFDNCVHDLTQDRRNMDESNDWHTKLIVTKVIFQTLELSIKDRKQKVFYEIHQYSDFDRQCHSKLRNFAALCLKLGQYRMKVGLNQWYDKSLKPLRTRQQNDDISIVIDCNRLQARVFYAWQQYQQNKMDAYHFKTNAIQKIWHHLNKDAKQEKKRAIDIWKQKQGFQSQTKKTIKSVLNKYKLRMMEQAFKNWRCWSMQIENAVRERILTIDYTSKAFLTQVFNQWKITTRIEKQNRQRILNAYLKAWQDYMKYNRQLMQMNMAAITFGQTNRDFTTRNVFNALRQHAESKKYALMKQAVEEDMNVAIAKTQEFNKNRADKFDKANKTKAGNIVRDMLGKRLFTYFQHWRDVNADYHQTMDTKVKGKIIKMYKKYLSIYFTYWKKNLKDQERKKKMNLVQELQSKAEQQTLEALEQEKELRTKAELNNSQKRCMVDKTFRKLFLRRCRCALMRWKEICLDRGNKEDNVSLMIKRMRNRFLRQAFDRYLAFFKKSQQHSKNEKSADYLVDTLNMRAMRKVFFAMCYYTKWRQRVKQVWNKVLYRLDFFQKQRGIKRWCDNAHEKWQNKLISRQDGLTETIKQHNETISNQLKIDHAQKSVIADKNKYQRKKAYRQIALFFQRAYTTQTGEKFYIWKQKTQYYLHLKKIMRRSVEHYNRNYKEAVQRVFLKFLSDDRRRERLAEIKATQINCHDLQLTINANKEKADKHRARINIFQGETNCASEELERKVLHTMECMERRNKDWVHVSRKRIIFEMWRHVCKQEKAFAYAVKNVLEKSLYKEGFGMIQNAYRDLRYTDQVHYQLKKWSIRSQKVNLGDGFTKWKKFSLSKVEGTTDQTQKDFLAAKKKFEDFVNRAKDTNCARCFKYFNDINKQNTFRAWVNAIKHLKRVKAKTVEFKQRQLDLRRSFGLQRWYLRLQKTKNCKARRDQLVARFQFKYMKACFYGWMKQWKRDKHFLSALSNLEKMMRTKISTDSFKAVRTFAVSKGLVYNNRQAKGAEDLANLIRNAYLKQLHQEFQRWIEKSGGNDEKDEKLSMAFKRANFSRLRDAFSWWKRKHELKELAKDLYECGPVRAEHWQAERDIANLLDFMRSERYSEREIEKFFGDVCKSNDDKMKKYMARWRIRQDSKRKILPIVWNRWREFVGIRKLVKYQFKFCHNSTRDQKADLQRAFNKMKLQSQILEEELWKLPYTTLTDLGLKTTKELDECHESIAENQSINNHLLLQRDEFLNYYIKGQILAMALIKDRNTFAEMQGISRWLWARRNLVRIDYEREIRDGAYLHANLQEKEKKLNKENATYEKENAELSQFTQDGVVIKQSMLKLHEECTVIRSRIEETDEDYQELLEQNASLLRDVAEAEAKAKAAKENGAEGKFAKQPTIKNIQNDNEDVRSPVRENETEEQKAQRLRFERLQKISKGAALR